MGYNGAIFFLCGYSLCVSLMAVCRKEYQKNAGTALKSVAFFICMTSIIGFLFGMIVSKGIVFDLISIILAFGYSFLSVITSVLCLIGTKYGSLTGMTLYAFLGTLTLPTIYGFFTEDFNLQNDYLKLIGFFIAIIILVYDVLDQKNSLKNKNKLFKLLCFFVFFTNGSALIVFKLFGKICINVNNFSFVALCMLISAIGALIILLINISFSNQSEKIKINSRVILFIILYAATFFLSDNLALKCTELLPIMVQATLSFCMPIIFTAMLELFIYKEKLNKKSVIQIILSFLCCICFAMQ